MLVTGIKGKSEKKIASRKKLLHSYNEFVRTQVPTLNVRKLHLRDLSR